MHLGVLADPAAADHDIVEGNVEYALLQVNVTDLQCAKLAAAGAARFAGTGLICGGADPGRRT